MLAIEGSCPACLGFQFDMLAVNGSVSDFFAVVPDGTFQLTEKVVIGILELC